MTFINLGMLSVRDGVYITWKPLDRAEFERMRAVDQRRAFYGPRDEPVRIIRWYPSGIRVRFAGDRHVKTVHPGDVHAAPARLADPQPADRESKESH
jgi:hypothetical protein